MKIKTREMVYCALFAALTAVFSQIVIPIGLVPINLATLSVLLCGAVLGKKYGSLSIFIYVVLGAVGVPVFASFKGGLSVLAGPTGGYILGYIAMAFLTGLGFEKYEKMLSRVLMMVLATLVCYTFGTAWFMISAKADFVYSLFTCVLPFLPFDAVKIAICYIAADRIRKVM